MTYELDFETCSNNVRGVKIAHESLMYALSEQVDVCVNLGDAKDMDIVMVQLLEAARTYAISNGKTLSLKLSSHGTLQALLARSGFIEAMTPEQAAFWTIGAQDQ